MKKNRERLAVKKLMDVSYTKRLFIHTSQYWIGNKAKKVIIEKEIVRLVIRSHGQT